MKYFSSFTSCFSIFFTRIILYEIRVNFGFEEPHAHSPPQHEKSCWEVHAILLRTPDSKNVYANFWTVYKWVVYILIWYHAKHFIEFEIFSL